MSWRDDLDAFGAAMDANANVHAHPTAKRHARQERPRQEREAEADPSLAGFLSTGHWLERELEPPEPLLGEVITNTTRMFIAGPTGLGKTHLGMAIAAGMATGAGFLHWKASRPCRVLYLDGEMPRDLVQERLADILRRTPAELRPALRSNLIVLCWEDCEALAERFPKLGELQPLNTEEGHAFVLRLVEMLGGADAVFFDNRMSLLAGDMKEEEPWTDTMPLVKELTRRRIAQIWLDHTGHAADRVYGTKTKEWPMDAVALLTKAERPGLDIAFKLEFTKARRRKPSNRADFETVTFAMVDDAWTVENGESGRAAGERRSPLRPRERLALGFLHNLLATEGKPLPPAWNLPPDLRCVPLERFKEECERRGLSQADNAKNRRDSINQAVSALQASTSLSINKGFVWAVRPESAGERTESLGERERAAGERCRCP